MKIPFVLTRANFIDIMEGFLLFSDQSEYELWMKTNFERFQISTNIQTRILTLINF
jgi:hypothetical protein